MTNLTTKSRCCSVSVPLTETRQAVRYRYQCTCGQKWLGTFQPDGSLRSFQCHPTRGKRQQMIRMYPDVKRAVVAEHGSVQKYVDNKLREDGYIKV